MMTSELHEYMTGIASTQISLFGLLVDHLEREGVLDKSKFAGELRNIVELSQQSEKPLQRYQAMIFDQVIGWMAKKEHHWTPVVINGKDNSASAEKIRQSAPLG